MNVGASSFACAWYVKYYFFFFNDTATTEIYTLSLHDALPILRKRRNKARATDPPASGMRRPVAPYMRSEEHTSELQSRFDLVCRLLLEKKKKRKYTVGFYLLRLMDSTDPP